MNRRRPRALVSWSSGKDAAWALHRLEQAGQFEVAGLLTTFNGASGRVGIHEVERELVAAQAEAVGLPLLLVPLPWPCPNAVYEQALWAALAEAKADLGVTHVAFGDLFLADIRAYREALLAPTGVLPLFPLWQTPTNALAREMIAGGLRAQIVSVDTARLPAAFAGRPFDNALLADLPVGVDPCGEHGEFHTFVWDGPMFARPVTLAPGAL